MKKLYKTNRKNIDIDIKDIHPNFKNPRKGEYEERKLDELKESMNAIGQLTPLKVDAYGTILAGHRRYEAAKMLNWESLRADVFVGLSEFEKSAILISDNSTQEKFNAWQNRKAIADIYFNEFCEEYTFKTNKDKGYTTFASKLGISVGQAKRCIESMAKTNIALATKLEKAGCTPDIFDEVLATPDKYRRDVMDKAIELTKKRSSTLAPRTQKPRQKSNKSIKDRLRMYRRKLRADNAKRELNPAFFKVIFSKLDDISLVLTPSTIRKASLEDKLKIKDFLNKKFKPVMNELKKYNKNWKPSLLDNHEE